MRMTNDQLSGTGNRNLGPDKMGSVTNFIVKKLKVERDDCNIQKREMLKKDCKTKEKKNKKSSTLKNSIINLNAVFLITIFIISTKIRLVIARIAENNQVQ